MDEEQIQSDIYDPYQEMVKEKSAYLFCDACGNYPMSPVHGHFVCPKCFYQTRCCEGAPIDND